MSPLVNANINANQFSTVYNPAAAAGLYPISQGLANLTSPFGSLQALLRGPGTIEAGPTGIKGSLALAKGYTITPANTSNGLGVGSAFGTPSLYLNRLGGSDTPLLSMNDLPMGLAGALGGFGGNIFGNPLSNSIFPDLSSLGSGQPGAGMDPNAGYPGGQIMGGYPGMPQGYPGGQTMGGYPGMPQGYPGGQPMGGYPGMPQGYPGGQPMGGYPGMPQGYPGGQPMGGYPGMPQGYPGGQPMGGDPNQGGLPNGAQGAFNAPGLFGGVSPNSIPGIAQIFRHAGDGFQNGYNLVSDGIAKLFLQGLADPRMPEQLRGANVVSRTPYGTFQGGIGPNGGDFQSGLYGTSASGDAWALTTAANNDAMIVSYSNPKYDQMNWAQQGFTKG